MDWATLTPSLQHRITTIKAVSLDVDGVLTDGRITYTSSGEELMSFQAHDGHGIKMLLDRGFAVTLITGRESPMVTRRASELGIYAVAQGVVDKVSALREFAAEQSIDADLIVHVGDDIADLSVHEEGALLVAVADAPPAVRAAADLVTDRNGGFGAVREICDLLLAHTSLTQA